MVRNKFSIGGMILKARNSFCFKESAIDLHRDVDEIFGKGGHKRLLFGNKNQYLLRYQRPLEAHIQYYTRRHAGPISKTRVVYLKMHSIRGNNVNC